jgi:hypothetical protein
MVTTQSHHRAFPGNLTPKRTFRLARDTGAERAHIYGKPTVEVGPMPREPAIPRSLQLGVFRLGLLENLDVGVGVLPEREEPSYALFALALSPDKAYALPRCTCARAPIGSAKTTPP